MPDYEPAVILSACRTPIGTFGGALKDVPVVDLGATVIREAVRRAGVAPADLGDVILGCVLQGGAGMNVARQAAIRAGVPPEVPAETVNRVCGSGLQAVVHAVEATRVGYTTMVLAGGMESMSQAPYVLRQARWGYRLGHGEVTDTLLGDGLTCAIEGCHMGNTAEEVARRFGIDRAAQDRFAATSQQRAAAAMAAGLFDEEIVAVEVPQRKGAAVRVTRDEHPRPGATEAALAALRPAFDPQGTVTAGNASGINDGAAAVVVATEDRAKALGVTPIARILSFATTGVEPRIMGMGAAAAGRKALDRAGLRAGDIDLAELNEAFAAQAIAVVQDLGLDPARVNVRGGAIALGHPIGASGARILTTLIYALRAQGGGTGLASLCIGGGMGIAMVVDVPA